MSEKASACSRARRGLLTTGVVGTALSGLLVGVQAPAASAAGSSLGSRAVQVASQQQGKPYRSGAAGPYAFDCSGLTQYVYGRLGVSLPRTTDAQYAALRHVSNSSKQPGDLVFVRGRGGLSHVGIYAGNGKWWVARHSGTTVTLQSIYTDNVVVGRV